MSKYVCYFHLFIIDKFVSKTESFELKTKNKIFTFKQSIKTKHGFKR